MENHFVFSENFLKLRNNRDTSLASRGFRWADILANALLLTVNVVARDLSLDRDSFAIVIRPLEPPATLNVITR